MKKTHSFFILHPSFFILPLCPPPRPGGIFYDSFMSRPTRNLLQIHAAVLLFGLSGLFGKFREELAPLVIVFGRVVFAALALWFVSLLWKLPLWPNSGRTLLAFFGLGILLAVHWTTFFAAVQASSVAL